jgi:hypothetical protein
MSSDTSPVITSETSLISPEIEDAASECLSYDDRDFTWWEYSGHCDYNSLMDCGICNDAMFNTSRTLDEVAWNFEPYRDLRSAAHGKHRARSIRENKSNVTNSFKGRMQWQTMCRRDNKRKKKAVTKLAKLESQKDVHIGRHRVVEWDIHLPEELDRVFDDMQDVKRYRLLHQDASIFESSEPYSEVGELFVPWAQRRIAEMRGVKESRIRRSAPLTLKPMVWHDKIDRKYVKRYKIYTGDASTTTLPTNSYDALGHELLRSVLDPGKWWVKKCLREGKQIIRAIHNDGWFGEYEWHWHRDVWGRWEIEYGWDCTAREGWYRMAREMDVGKVPMMEEVRRCSLFEWLRKEGRDIILRDEAMVEEWIRLLDDDGNVSGSESDYGWSIVSLASSETWSVVDAAQ